MARLDGSSLFCLRSCIMFEDNGNLLYFNLGYLGLKCQSMQVLVFSFMAMFLSRAGAVVVVKLNKILTEWWLIPLAFFAYV